MKILVSGNYDGMIPVTPNCADALEELGHKVMRFDSEDRINSYISHLMQYAKSLAKLVGGKQALSNYFTQYISTKRHNKLLSTVAEFKPNMILVIRLNSFDAKTMLKLRRHSYTVCWMIEPKPFEIISADVPIFDLYYSMHHIHESIGAIYLPVFAYDKQNYFIDNSVTKDQPLLFIGGWSPRRQLWLEALNDLSDQLAIIGTRWTKKLGSQHPLYNAIRGDWVSGSELRHWYQRTRIVININRLDMNQLNISGSNLRTADVPACGTVLLTEYSSDLDQHFVIDEEIAVFHNPLEMREQCNVLLSNLNRWRLLVAAGISVTKNLGTYQDRMARILQDVATLSPKP